MRRSTQPSNQPPITARFVRRKPDKLMEAERRAPVSSTPGVASSAPGVAGLTRKRVVGSPGVSGVPGGSIQRRSGRASLLESSDIKKSAYKVQKDWKRGSKPSFTSNKSWNAQPAPTAEPEALPPLSDEQMHIVDLVCKKRENVFFTGEAGTGKSLIIKTITRRFQDSGICCHVTAPTGLAAVNIGGVTTYRWAGLGLLQGEPPALAAKIARNQVAKQRWLDTKVLIIDEVSMFSAELFHKLSEVGKLVRKNEKRQFGGIQLVLTGDFFQLPPVGMSTKWLFAHDTFKKAIRHRVQLTKVYRQQGDTTLTTMLRKLRYGNPEDHNELARFFGGLARELNDSDGIVPTVLEPRNDAVNLKNQQELEKLPGPEFTLKANDTANGNSMDHYSAAQQEETKRRLDENLRVPGLLKLKLGAQVMVMKNIYKGANSGHVNLVNGNMGIVKWLMSANKYYAISQSGSGRIPMFEAIEWVEGILKKGKPPGYYPRTKDIRALRDCPEPESKYVVHWDAAKEHLLEIYEIMEVQYRFTPNPQFDCDAFDALLPVVKFVDDTYGTRYMHLGPEGFEMRTKAEGEGDQSASNIRKQVPLILAWAMSIHKCQGQTLGKVKVDLSKAFCMGQAYVALSRVTKKENLQVVGFDPRREKPSQEVIDFYRQFQRPFERVERVEEVKKNERLEKMVEELDDDLDDLF